MCTSWETFKRIVMSFFSLSLNRLQDQAAALYIWSFCSSQLSVICIYDAHTSVSMTSLKHLSVPLNKFVVAVICICPCRVFAVVSRCIHWISASWSSEDGGGVTKPSRF